MNTTVPYQSGTSPVVGEHGEQSSGTGLVFIFSADIDLATSLTMLLEERFSVLTVNDKHGLTQQIRAMKPSVIVMDMPSSPAESLKQLALLKDAQLTIPVILLRNYRGNQELEREIQHLASFTFFKPLEVERLYELISTLMSLKNNS